MNIREIIREEIEMPDGVNIVSVIYFPSDNVVLDKHAYMRMYGDEYEDLEMVYFDPKNVSHILNNGFIGDGERILKEIQDWLNEYVEAFMGEDREYYQKRLYEATIRTFVIRAEELPRTDSSFFDNF